MSGCPGFEATHGAVDASGLQALGGGQRRQDGRQSLGQQGFARAGRADHQDVVTAGRGDEQGALGVVLAFHIDEVLVHVGMLGEEFVEIDGLGVHVDLPGEEADGLGEAADRIDIQSLDDGGFGGVGPGHEQPIAALGDGLEGHREDPLDGPGVAGEGELADDGVVAGPVEGHLTAGQQQPQRNRQIKTVGVLLEIGRSQSSRRKGASVHYLLCYRRSWRSRTPLDRANARTTLGLDPRSVPVHDNVYGDRLDAFQRVRGRSNQHA